MESITYEDNLNEVLAGHNVKFSHSFRHNFKISLNASFSRISPVSDLNVEWREVRWRGKQNTRKRSDAPTFDRDLAIVVVGSSPEEQLTPGSMRNPVMMFFHSLF